MTAHVSEAVPATVDRLARQAQPIAWLARLDGVSDRPAPPGSAAQIVVAEATYTIPLDGVIDLAAERARLAKNALAAEKERDALATRLAAPGFTERAKPEAVDKARADHAARAAEAERLRAALARLG